ncbi:hypothetical protein AURDEDRAFT_172399 [Auricularia subglabra TFB-10046 SS5]|nr:hypothetical protein AURDEDRAFT_172399 [Auricularia subglabra TFB-10046 SS5]
MGRAPSKLLHLCPQTEHDGCNIGQYISEWAVEACSIHIWIPALPISSLAFFLRDAQQVTIRSQLKNMVISLPAGRVFSVNFESRDFLYLLVTADVLVDGLWKTPGGLPQLRTLTTPLEALHKFLRQRPPLPSLSEACITITQTGRVLDLTRLSCLATPRQYALSSCTFAVHTMGPPASADANSIISDISQYLRVADEAAITTEDGLSIRFEQRDAPLDGLSLKTELYL